MLIPFAAGPFFALPLGAASAKMPSMQKTTIDWKKFNKAKNELGGSLLNVETVFNEFFVEAGHEGYSSALDPAILGAVKGLMKSAFLAGCFAITTALMGINDEGR